MAIDINICKVLAHPKSVYPITPKCQIEWNDLLAIASFDPIRSALPRLVQPTPEKFHIEVECQECKSKAWKIVTRTAVIGFIRAVCRSNSSEWTCERCGSVVNQRQSAITAEKYKQYLILQGDLQKEARKELSETFLVPGWKPSSYRKIYCKLTGLCSNAGDEWVSDCIKSLHYRDFLNTSYWSVISYRVKSKANMKCHLCGSDKYLNAHHRDYEYHGYEHTYDGLRSLVCLCNSCHQTHHNILQNPMSPDDESYDQRHISK